MYQAKHFKYRRIAPVAVCGLGLRRDTINDSYGAIVLYIGYTKRACHGRELCGDLLANLRLTLVHASHNLFYTDVHHFDNQTQRAYDKLTHRACTHML